MNKPFHFEVNLNAEYVSKVSLKNFQSLKNKCQNA